MKTNLDLVQENINLLTQDGNSQLHIAVMDADIEKIQLEIKKGADVNLYNQYKRTPLHLAVSLKRENIKNKSAIIDLLLKHKADACKKAYYDFDLPIVIAAEQNDVESFQQLLPYTSRNNFFFDVYASDNNKYPWYLYMMFETRSIEILALLKANGADLNTKSMRCSQDTLLTYAIPCLVPVKDLSNREMVLKAINQFKNTVYFLLENGVDVNLGNYMDIRPLHNLIYFIYLNFPYADHGYELLDLFIKKGADVNFVDINGDTPLHWAVRYSLLQVTETLVKHGADPLLINKNKLTPLELSKEKHSTATHYEKKRILDFDEKHAKIQKILSERMSQLSPPQLLLIESNNNNTSAPSNTGIFSKSVNSKFNIVKKKPLKKGEPVCLPKYKGI